MDQGTGWPEVATARARLQETLPAYSFESPIGRGAFGVVYAAHHKRLDREVAVKWLGEDVSLDADARQRFGAEARLLASLDHPHVVRVYDYVEEDDVCALVMERMRGGTLADRMRNGRLPVATACAIMVAVLNGIEHAHQRGVLHRDIKPENLLFADDGLLVKVADFGIAKVLRAGGARLTATAGTLGTPTYMAPEQVRRAAGPLSSATDVWSAGAVLYELLAGTPPFAASGTVADVLLERVERDAPPLSEVAPAVPEPIADVVMRALRRAPGERHPSAGLFASELETAVGAALGADALEATGVPIHHTPAAPGTGGPTLVEPHELATAGGGRARRRVLATAAAALVAAGAVVAVVVAGGDDDGGHARIASPAGGLPTGWPHTMPIGFKDWGAASGGPAATPDGGMTFAHFGGDPLAHQDWSHEGAAASPAAFVANAAKQGRFPYATYYVIRKLGTKGKGDTFGVSLRHTVADKRLMTAYWGNVRAFLRQMGRSGRPAAVAIDEGMWASLQLDLNLQSRDPFTLRFVVGGSGLPELRGLTDDFASFQRGWINLRNRYAPKVLLGYELDDYASGDDFTVTRSTRARIRSSAREAARFHNLVAPGFDFAGYPVNYWEEGQDPSRNDVYTAAERRAMISFLRQFVARSRTPVVLEKVPAGNTAMRTITDKPFHWRDRWAQWLLGDRGFANLGTLRDIGVIGIAFGVNDDQPDLATCPCDAAHDGITNDGPRGRTSTVADDDGGYLRERLGALRKAGGVPLA